MLYKGTVDEIPVGYVALDVQKIQYQTDANNKTWTNGMASNAGGGEHSCIYNGNAYYSAGRLHLEQYRQATAPTHNGTVSDGQIGVCWCRITRLYLYGYTSLQLNHHKLSFSIGARKQDIAYVTLIDSSNNSTPTTYAALLTPTGAVSPTDAHYRYYHNSIFG